jgi:hypothetical protein
MTRRHITLLLGCFSFASLGQVPGVSFAQSATDPQCVYVDFDCDRSARDVPLDSVAVWARLDAAVADQDLEAALAEFTDTAEVDDHAGRHSTGIVEIRQWLQEHAIPEFREHVGGSLRVFGDRMGWVDLVTTDERAAVPVQLVASLRDGKIQTLQGTDLASLPTAPRVAPVSAEGMRLPLLLSLLIPLVGWLGLVLSLRFLSRRGEAARSRVPAVPRQAARHQPLG